MAIQRWDPLRDLLQLRERMNRLLDETLTRSGSMPADAAPDASAWRPPVDVTEESERYVLRADLPGVEASELQVEVENGHLTLSGERRPHPEAAPESYLRRERRTGPFSIRIALPESVSVEGIQAIQRNGVLEVVLPKKESLTPGRVRVSVS